MFHYFPSVFPSGMFEQLNAAHTFQCLTESSKPSVSYRKGLYLSRVNEQTGKFNLLRCSTNLDGPTAAFSAVDEMIVGRVNELVQGCLPGSADVNHVLAQVYMNTGPKKARISAHSDKTKDMPENGVMAFCTFYSEHESTEYGKKKTTVYTRLLFRKKDGGEEFSVTLEDGSVLIIPLSTNALYTHETVPSVLDASKIPTRLGYVARCSKTVAVHRDECTLIRSPSGTFVPLREPTQEDIAEIKALYFRENTTTERVEYGFIDYSLNKGDFIAPLV